MPASIKFLKETVPAGFLPILEQYSWDDVSACIASRTEADVRAALDSEGPRTPEDFMALVSPAAEPLLETMARMSRSLTLKRFGRTIQMYIPLYLSNRCTNKCLYCGFNSRLAVERKTLTLPEIMEEVRVIKSYGFDHILLVTGESPRDAGIEYFESVLDAIRPSFASISMEVQPLAEEEYRRLRQKGLNSVYLYQETYNRNSYRKYHPGGLKKSFSNRLAAPEAMGKAGIHKIGLGFLAGLENWRTEAFFASLHLAYLEKTYWRTRFCLSFPRLKPAEGSFQIEHPVSDRELVQLICAYRLFSENTELSLSTREPSALRDHLLQMGITNISAGSRTFPGGHVPAEKRLAQFSVSDSRSPQVMAEAIRGLGYEVVWKDWDQILAQLE